MTDTNAQRLASFEGRLMRALQTRTFASDYYVLMALKQVRRAKRYQKQINSGIHDCETIHGLFNGAVQSATKSIRDCWINQLWENMP